MKRKGKRKKNDVEVMLLITMIASKRNSLRKKKMRKTKRKIYIGNVCEVRRIMSKCDREKAKKEVESELVHNANRNEG